MYYLHEYRRVMSRYKNSVILSVLMKQNKLKIYSCIRNTHVLILNFSGNEVVNMSWAVSKNNPPKKTFTRFVTTFANHSVYSVIVLEDNQNCIYLSHIYPVITKTIEEKSLSVKKKKANIHSVGRELLQNPAVCLNVASGTENQPLVTSLMGFFNMQSHIDRH